MPDVTAPNDRDRARPGSFVRTALALAIVGATGAGVFAGLVVDRPAPTEAATVAPLAPAPLPVQAPPTTSVKPTATVSPRPTTTAPSRSTSATSRKRTSSVPATPRKRYTEDELRERSEDLTTDDLRAGRGSMPDGGLTSGEHQLLWACRQDPAASYC